MFSPTVMWGKRAYSWNTVFVSRWCGGTEVTSRPPSSIRPPSGRSNPAISRSKVVFPDPDGPSKVKNSPDLTTSSTSARATTSPYRFRRPVTWIAGAAAVGSPAAAGCAGPGTVIIRLVVPRFSRDPQCGPCSRHRQNLNVMEWTGQVYADNPTVAVETYIEAPP